MATTIIESLFQRSLEDLVKGLRVQMIGEAAFLSKAFDEVKREIKSTDIHTKSVAVQKLTYLSMLQGTDMSWASFQVVEVMSMPKFSIKKIGYLAASQSFNESTDVILLITNLLRKDLGGKNEYETSLALDCLSRVGTPDLSRDLMPDLFTLLVSGRPTVRKRATATLSRVFTQYPDAIRVALRRLIEKLSDTDSAVVTAAVSVLCDLALKDPKPFLPLAPELYNLLVRSPSNWLCIKLVKILGALTPLEPRLGKKIADPICDLIRKSEAKSLVLECIQTVTNGLGEHRSAVTLCVEKLGELMREEDANLKYLCLRAFANLMPVHPWAIAANKEAIVKCLSHRDPSIQNGARHLIIGMVSESNVMATVQVLLQHAHTTDADSRNEVLSDVLQTCSADRYDLISDFSWYVGVLAEMALFPHSNCGDEIGRQLIDIGFRVKSAIGDVVKASRNLLLESALLERASVHGVLSASAWIAGEYVAQSSDTFELIEALLQPRIALLPSSVRAVYVQAVLKVLIYTSVKFVTPSLTGSRSWINKADHFTGVSSNNPGEIETPPHQHNLLARLELRNTPVQSTAGSTNFSHAESTHYPGTGEDNWEATADVERDHNERAVDQVTASRHCETQGESNEKVSDSATMRIQSLVAFLRPTVRLIAENMATLETSLDVEVQERACNLLGLLQVMKEVAAVPLSGQINSPKADEFLLLLDALMEVFTPELAPVSVHAQSKVTPPSELIENLDSLRQDENKQNIKQDLFGSHTLPEWEQRNVLSFRSQSTDPVGESSALLAEHRQRHQSFYLPRDENPGTNSVGYPPPVLSNPDPVALLSYSQNSGSVPSGDDPKPPRAKPRPVVVKLDGDDDQLATPVVTKTKTKKKDLKDEVISNAIMDVLVGGGPQRVDGEAVRTRHHRAHGSRSSRGSGREIAAKSQSSVQIGHGPASELSQSIASEAGGSPSTSSQASRQTKSTRRHRHTRHGNKEISSNVGFDELQASRFQPILERE